MLQEFPSTKSSKRCSISGQDFAPGETYVSVLVSKGDDISRMDISTAHWKEAPPEAIGWWKCRVPDSKRQGTRPAPDSVLLDTLSELLRFPDRAELAYLLALLLVRRRVLLEEQRIDQADDPSGAFWNLIQPADGRQWQVPICLPDPARQLDLQESLFKLLFTDE